MYSTIKTGLSDTSLKILIPNEKYKNDDQKQSDIMNFEQSGLTAKEWRKKCYNNITFNIFGNQVYVKLIEIRVEIVIQLRNFIFKNYYNYLLQISELCAFLTDMY